METKSYFKQLSPERYSERPQSLPAFYTPQSDESDEGGLDLGQLFAAVRRRTLVIVGITIAVASAALAQSLTSTPVYEAEFELLITPVTVENQLTSSPLSEERQTSSVDQTQLLVLQSPKLMTPIVKQIHARYPGSGFPQLNINLLKDTNIIQVSYQDPDPEKVQFILNTVADAYLKFSLEEHLTDARQGIRFVEEQLPQLKLRVKTLQDQLQTFRQRYDLIDSAGKGQQLSSQLNGIVQQRLEAHTQVVKARSLYTSLQNQLQMQPNEAEAALALSEAPAYQNLLNQLQQLETQIAIQTARYNEDSPNVQNLRAQQRNLLPLVEQERRRILGDQLSSTTGKSRGLASPNSIRLQQMQQFFDNAHQIQALEAQDKALAQVESLLRQQVKQFPLIARQNDDLERQLKIAIDNLNQFLTKREALRIDAAQKQVPWQLVTPPTMPQASSSSVKLKLALGLTLGLLLGIGAALLVDKFKNVFYTPEDVKDTTRLPLLGEIPVVANVIGLTQEADQGFWSGKSGKLFQQQNSSYFWESLRSLYTNIRFLSFNTPVKSLAVISADSKEGRSTIAVHLAQTAAVMGQRVLLVDADLRSPKIHTVLNLPNTKGLSNAIAEELNIDNFIQQVNCVSMRNQNYDLPELLPKEIEKLPLQDIFFVLTAGQVPPNPTSLLSSQKMQALARQFETEFDLIIYDTSPVLDFADSSVLAVHTDASLLVVGIGKTDRPALVKVLEKLKFSSTPVLGVVANGVKG